MVKVLPTEEVVSITIEFLLRQVGNDPVALLQAVAQYSVVTRVGRARSLCSQECLLKAALCKEQDCSQCQKLAESRLARQLSEPRRDRSSAEQQEGEDVSASGTSESVERESEQVAGERGVGLGSKESSVSLDLVIRSAEISSKAEGQSRDCSTSSEDASDRSGAASELTGAQSLEEEESSPSKYQERQRDSKAASIPVPKLALKDLSEALKAGGVTRDSDRISQSARGPRPQPMHSPGRSGGVTFRSSLSEGPRPQTAVSGRGKEVKDVQSEGSSPTADVRVKALMTPDEHIKEWLIEKKRKEAQREKRIRRRQLAELEFIASLRKSQARRLRRIEDEEKKLALAASAIEPLFKAQCAQARYKGLKGGSNHGAS